MDYFVNILVFALVVFVISLVFEYSLIKHHKNPKKKIYGHVLAALTMSFFSALGRYNLEWSFIYAFFIMSVVYLMAAGVSFGLYLTYQKFIKKKPSTDGETN